MARFTRYAAAAGATAAILSGCASLPEPDPSRGDCQLRAGATILEGSVEPWAQGGAAGGAVTLIGTCPEALKVLTRTPNGSIVCHGSEAWCDAALTQQPVSVTAQQLREIAGRGE